MLVRTRSPHLQAPQKPTPHRPDPPSPANPMGTQVDLMFLLHTTGSAPCPFPSLPEGLEESPGGPDLGPGESSNCVAPERSSNRPGLRPAEQFSFAAVEARGIVPPSCRANPLCRALNVMPQRTYRRTCMKKRGRDRNGNYRKKERETG